MYNKFLHAIIKMYKVKDQEEAVKNAKLRRRRKRKEKKNNDDETKATDELLKKL